MKTIALLLGLALVAVVLVVMANAAEATPYFTTKTNYKIIGIVKTVGPDGKSNDCYHEHYLRATPKNNNHVLLNKETIKNNDAPDNGPSEIHKFSWYYDFNKMKSTAATNEGRIRLYDTIELTDSLTGETVTKYIHAGTDTHSVDFGVFVMHVDPRLCQ